MSAARNWLASRCTRTSSATALLLLTLAPAAPAATATTDGGTLAFTGAPGEVNTLDIRYADGAVTVTESTAPLTAGGRCRSRDANSVVCRSVSGVDVDLGDLADTVVVVAAPGQLYVTLEGGAGNDRLTGDAGNETLYGDDGDDTLDAAGGDDNLYGGRGDDTLLGGDGGDNLYGGGIVPRGVSAGRDHLDGGAGNDLMSDHDASSGGPAGPDTLIAGEGLDYLYSYAGRRRGVTVDLSRSGGQGQRGENDTLSGFEVVNGSDGDDTLIGDAGPNEIDGAGGQDDIRGGGGDDLLISVPRGTEERPNHRAARYGPDRVSGDEGDDLIRTLATLESEVTCGDGFDRIVLESFSDDHSPSSLGPLVSASCERLLMGGSRARGGPFSLTPYPTTVMRDAFVFAVQAIGCCRRRFELQTLDDRPRLLAATTARKPTRLTVPRAATHARRGLRGKIEHVGRNRFVWRFRRGF